jgi:RNA polymerase sigma-70 factor (ECF subfamily)
MRSVRSSTTPAPRLDAESRAWLRRLGAGGQRGEAAVEELRALLLRATRFEIRRRAGALGQIGAAELDDLAQQSADDAVVAVLGKLAGFRGESRFTTWAYKFALFEAAVQARRRAWRGRELPLEPERWPQLPDPGGSTADVAESRELLASLQEAIAEELSPHQRRVLVAVVLEDVPIDVLAERLGTTRGALYKTLHDARRRLRSALDARGLRPHGQGKPT